MSKLTAFGLIAIAASLALSACSMFSSSSSSDEKDYPGCPSVAVLSEASEVTKLRAGGGKDPTDVMLTADIGKPTVSCEYDKDTRKTQVSLTLPITAKRGPAAGDAAESLNYFVAIIDTDNSVVMKHAYSHDVAFAGAPVVAFSDSIADTVFDVPKSKKPMAYEALVGFQLTRDELAYNHAHHRYVQ